MAASRRPATRKTPVSVPTGACRESASCARPSGTRRCFTDNAIFRRAPPFLPCRDARRRGCCAAAAAPKNGQEKPLHILAVLIRQDKRGRKHKSSHLWSGAGAGRAVRAITAVLFRQDKRRRHKLGLSLKRRRGRKGDEDRLRGVALEGHKHKPGRLETAQGPEGQCRPPSRRWSGGTRSTNTN